MHPLIERLQSWGSDIEREFNESRSKGGSRSPQDVADFREQAIRDFLENFFPFPYRIAKGVARDCDGNESASIDVIVLNPVHPFTKGRGEKFSLLLADGIDLAVEVKSDPESASEIETCMAQAQKTKVLRRVNKQNIYSYMSDYQLPIDQKVLKEELSREIPYFVFFMKKPTDIAKSLSLLKRYCRLTNQRCQPDFFIINGSGIVANIKSPGSFGYQNVGLYFEEWRQHTMSGMLLHANAIYPAAMPIQQPFLIEYLKPVWQTVRRTSIL